MKQDIILENPHFQLVVGADCRAKSLLHKASGQECLLPSENIALFSVTQPRPFNNEVKLAYPNKRTTFQANRVRREGDKLIVGFEIIHYEAIIEIKEAPEYISFKLVDFLIHPGDFPAYMNIADAPVESFRILQLPVKDRTYFGQWLNVSWDEAVAVNLLATSPYAIIEAEKRRGHRILTADALRGVKLRGTEAALIVTQSDHLLDAIDRLEQDYDLPRGVQSRRSKQIRMSSYFPTFLNPDTVDAHIAYCKRCGYQMMTLYYASVFEGSGYDRCGDYDTYRPSYPEGFESLRRMVQKIKAAGIIPGLHFLHPHIGLKSKYVTPIADHRLHKIRYFTLSKPLDPADTTIYVEQNPEDSVMADGCRILQFGGELISYEQFTTQRPYCFTGCRRGYLDTYVTEHPLGQIGGILDVSEFGAQSCYLDQDTDLQDEVSQKLAQVYAAGFEYLYFDGSEGTNAPFAFHVPNAQYRTYQLMKPEPIMAEGAAKAHFSWHMLSGGNAFDVFHPSVFKEMIRQHPVAEALRMQQDFTRLNFGWWYVFMEDDCMIEPDHWEYGTCMAAAWNCPATFQADLESMERHPRTDDLLEILRRWEDVRVNDLLTEAQRQQLRDDPMQEHILLINEDKQYELVPYSQIPTQDEALRAFAFERKGRSYVVYWHAYGNGILKLPFPVSVQDDLYGQIIETDTLPVGHRRYASARIPVEKLSEAFRTCVLTDTIP